MECPEDGIKMRLRRYSDLVHEIEFQERRLESIRSDMGDLKSPSFDSSPSSLCDVDGVHRKAMRAIELEKRIESDMLIEESERSDLERMVSKIPKAMERAVIRMRYFDGESWDEIAFILYGDKADFLLREEDYRRMVYRRHTEAILSLALVEANESISRRSA